MEAGAFDTADRLISVASAGPADEMQLAHVDLLRARLAFISSRGARATSLLLAAAERLIALDPNLARETYLDAFAAALFAARLSGSVGVAEVAQAARSAPQPIGESATAADLLLDALVMLTADYEAGVPTCRRALQTTDRRGSLARKTGCAGCGRGAWSHSSCGTTRAHASCHITACRSPEKPAA